ncbi:MAG: hypothetical protein AB1488_06470 [Nitrospirota bacterium]
MNDYLDKNAVDEFSDILSHWIDVYKWQNCSYVAIKSPTGPKLVFGRIILETSLYKDSITDFYLETQSIIAQHEILSAEPNNIDKRLLEAKEGLATYSKHAFNLKNKSGELPDFTCYPIYHPAISYGPRLPSLIIRERERHAILTMNLRLLDWELRSADQPFDSIEDLLAYMGFPVLSQMGDFATLEIVARTPTNISDKSIINNNNSTIIVNVSQDLDATKIKVGCKVFNKDGIKRFSVNGEKIRWTDNKDSLIGEYNHTVEDASWLQAFLSYEGLALHSWYVSDPQKQTNPRYSIHNLFDEKHDILQKFLLQAGYTSENFEDGVALLLNTLGFSIFHYGQIPKLKDGPDIIAFTPMGNIAVIECTIGLLDKEDKLAKLIQRTVLIKEKLKSAGFGHFSIQPIIVSKLPRTEVTGHLEEAGKHGIAVVCKEELNELLNRITSCPDPEGLFQEASRLIPKSEQLSLPDINNRT